MSSWQEFHFNNNNNELYAAGYLPESGVNVESIMYYNNNFRAHYPPHLQSARYNIRHKDKENSPINFPFIFL